MAAYLRAVDAEVAGACRGDALARRQAATAADHGAVRRATRGRAAIGPEVTLVTLDHSQSRLWLWALSEQIGLSLGG